MAEEQMTNCIAQSNFALAEMLARALQGLRPAPIPTIKLGRLMGHPQRAGDPTLADWLDDFCVYARQMAVSEDDRAVILLDHLGGCAKEEVLCHPLAMRESVESLVALLRSRFGPLESVHSLHAAFHERMQLEGESLADYSRVLMRLHDRMEQAAATLAEGRALALLRDNALKEQFVQGVRQQSVRQELRRLTLASVGRPFFQMRDEALLLLREDEEHSRRMRVCTTCVDQAQSEHVGESWSQVPVSSASASEIVLSQILKTQQSLQQQMLQLISQQQQTAEQVQTMVGQGRPNFPFSANRTPRPRGSARGAYLDQRLCHFCNQPGHFVRACPRKMELNAIYSHRNSCDVERHVKQLKEENDQLKEALDKIKNTSVSGLNERETKWKIEIHQLTFDLQRASRDARELNTQLMTLKGKKPEVVTRIERIEVESDTCKLALEKCSATLHQSRKETRCLRSQLTALGNKYQDVEQRLATAMEQDAHRQLVSRDHDKLAERLHECDNIERNDRLKYIETVSPLADPWAIGTMDDHVSFQALTNQAVRQASWANSCSHANPSHFPTAG